MAQKGKTQIWFEYAAFAVVLGLLRMVPEKAARTLGIATGKIGYRLFGKLRRVGMRNLELAFPEKGIGEREEILREVFRNLGRVMAVVSRFDGLSAVNIHDLIDYRPEPGFAEAYRRTIEQGRGRIILGGHMGNWELQAFSFPLFFEPLTFLARRMDNPLIDQKVKRLRERLGNRQIDKTNSAAPVLRALRSGGAVGVLADVNSHPKEGVFVPFFGIPACTATGVAMLAIRANAVIVPMWAVWDSGRGKYAIVHDEIIEPANTGDRQYDIVETTARYVAATERVIRRYPGQWIWIHRRWKTRPPGESELY